jgi:hypothetical protein
MIMPLLKVLLRPSRVRKSIFGNIGLLRRFTNDFPFSSKKCITRSDCTLRWDIYPQMNLKPWSYRRINPCTPVHHSNFDCPIPGVQSNVIIDPATTIHADPDPRRLKMLDESYARKLNPLVCIKNLWFRGSKSLF